MAKAQKIDEKEELKEQAGMAMTDGNAILGELETEMPKEEVSQEEKDKNPIQYKYEIKLKKLPRKLKSVVGLEVGKIGRVVEVLDSKTIMVDFWDTRPAKIPVRNSYVEVTRTRKEVEIAAGTYVEPVEEVKTSDDALTKQEGGNHYKSMKIQPVEFIHANNIGFLEGNVIKYICRHKNKNGIEDLKKVIHYAELLIQLEYKSENKDEEVK